MFTNTTCTFLCLLGPGRLAEACKRRSGRHFETDSLCCSLVRLGQERSIHVPCLTSPAAPRTAPASHPRDWAGQHHPALRERKKKKSIQCIHIVRKVVFASVNQGKGAVRNESGEVIQWRTHRSQFKKEGILTNKYSCGGSTYKKSVGFNIVLNTVWTKVVKSFFKISSFVKTDCVNQQ